MDFSAEELNRRRRGFTAAMNHQYPDWDTAVLTDSVNQYYLTGTIQDGAVFIRKDPGARAGSRLIYGVRRSIERAKLESPLFSFSKSFEENLEGKKEKKEKEETFVAIGSYRDLAEIIGPDLGNVYFEGDTLSLAAEDRLKKYFSWNRRGFLDAVIRKVRSVKSEPELALIRRSGEAHRILLEERVPGLLREGMTEASFLGELSAEMYRLGYQGLTRFHQSRGEMAIGQVGFGTNSLYPSLFDGPGGAKGYGPACPLSADPGKKLKKGDVVFVDIGFGVGGYHSDKTQVYVFGADPAPEFAAAHRFCIAIQARLAEQLFPGAVPSAIYQDIIRSIPDQDCFMGVDNRHRVKFLGHGIGLDIDELPVIAKGFDEPLEENMTLALEPKRGVPGIGMAGVEDTYIVSPGGGVCVTGGGREIIRV